MSDKRTSKRQPPIPWRPPAGREDEVKALADAKGLSVNALITACVFGENALPNARRVSPDKKLPMHGMRDAQCIADIAKEYPEVYERIQPYLSSLRNGFMRMIGRRS